MANSTSNPGRFFAVGVGPGDPELLTLKAAELIRRADVLYHAGPEPSRGRALDIINGLLRAEHEVGSVLAGPMSDITRENWKSAYRGGVERIAANCRQGRTVVFITEGDPTLYSSASYVWELLREIAPEVAIEVVPGVSSITAAAARLQRSLARRDETFAVLPALSRAADLPGIFEQFDSVCVLKPGRHWWPVLPTDWTADYVEEVSTPREWVTNDLPAASGRGSYFALVLFHRHRADEGAVALPPSRLGKVIVVGLGPGDTRLLTQQALGALREADVLVGYDAYLNSLEGLGLTAELRGSPIGAEAERAALAVELAASGRRVVLVSSGDAGVYGMASLLFETAAASPDLDIEVVPGVTAALAASALLGAPLGHDFACVSLSDLLTPWDVIANRLEAVGRGDFVLALYNPISQRRTWQLPRARDILLGYRSPITPVGIVERAYRLGSSVRLTTLEALTTDGVTMETLVLIGSSLTRVVNGRLVTPRGYGAKA